MDIDYHTIREFSASWGLVYLMAVFIIAVLWAFRPGSRKQMDDAAQIPFKEDQ